MSEIQSDLGYVLHQRPFRETSIWVECFTLNHGRLTFLAKGARQSKAGRTIQPFCPLYLNWRASRAGHTLYLGHVESQGAAAILQGDTLWCGLYLNELLLRVMQLSDPHPFLFQSYAETLYHLMHASSDQEIERNLRQFEKIFLAEMGHAICENALLANGEQIQTKDWYRFDEGLGFVKLNYGEAHQDAFLGENLLDIISNNWESLETLRTAKRLFRKILGPMLGHFPLNSRLFWQASGEQDAKSHQE